MARSSYGASAMTIFAFARSTFASFAAPAALALCGCAANGVDDPNDYGAESVATADDTRADAALDALLRHYWDDGSRYFRDTRDYWIDAQAFNAVLDGAQRTDRHRYMGWIRKIYEGQDARGWRRDYFDD